MGVLDSISRFIEALGNRAIGVVEAPTKKIPKRKSVQERLRILKELQKEVRPEREEELEREKRIEELLEWRKQEIQKPFSERVAESILKYFGGPVNWLTGFFRGLETDLYRASMFTTKEKYVALIMLVSIATGMFGMLFSYLLYIPLGTSALIGALMAIGALLYMRQYPRMVWRRRVSEVEKAMPYALRHMASLLRAGVGLPEAMLSVARADYGVISEEFELILRDMRSGSSFEDALVKFEEKMNSENVSRVVKQILRAIKFGGNLSDILYKLAEDFAFEYRMKLIEYVQKINGISFVYMFMTVVLPTMLVVGIIAGSIMNRAPIMRTEDMMIVLWFAFPTLSLIIINMIKKGEPR